MRAPPAPGVLERLLATACRLTGCPGAFIELDRERLAAFGSAAAGTRLAGALAGASDAAADPSEVVIADVPVPTPEGLCRLAVLGPEMRRLSAAEAFALVRLATDAQEILASASGQMPERTLRRHLLLALDFLAEGFLVIAEDTRILYANREMERILGVPRDALVGRPLAQALPADEGDRALRALNRVLRHRREFCFEARWPATGRSYQCRAHPCPRGVAVLCTDVTEQRRAESARQAIEAQLVQAQRMEALGTLAGGIAHDFNNVLSVILGNAGLLLSHPPAPEAAREGLGQIVQAATRARDMVQRILTFSRGAQREFEPAELRPMVEDALSLLRGVLPPNVMLLYEAPGPALLTTLNPTEAHQVLVNLCTNAWQAMPERGGRIRVSLEPVAVAAPRPTDTGPLRPGGYACLAVDDDGSGMPEAVRQRVLEPFFTTKSSGRGTGLGLYVVFGIVRSHGGAIRVASELGRGSRFEVFLPVVRAAEPSAGPAPAAPGPREAAAEAPPAAAGGGRRVAYVDDDAVVASVVERILLHAGFRVSLFGTPEPLMASLREDAALFDVLVTDQSMPGTTGLELARDVRGVAPALPVVLMTGLVSEELCDAARALGVAAVVRKESLFDALVPEVLRVLRGERG